MQGTPAMTRFTPEADRDMSRGELVSSVPPTAAEAAIAATRWQRRGLLGRPPRGPGQAREGARGMRMSVGAAGRRNRRADPRREAAGADGARLATPVVIG